MCFKNKFNFILMAIFLMIITTVALADSVVVLPDSVVIEPGHGIHFRAQIFSENGEIIRVPLDSYKWLVQPEHLGNISEDGYFIAGKRPGRGKVLAAIERGGKRIIGEADIWVGVLPHPPIKVTIKPKRAVVEPADTMKFSVVAMTADGRSLEIKRVRWGVRPAELGQIDARGLFIAGRKIMEGVVIAKVDLDGQSFTDEARVIVGPKPNSLITGQITEDATGAPIEKALVWAHRIGNIRWFSKAITNEKGEYILRHLMPGKYVIYTDARSYIREWYDNARHYEEATPVKVAEKDTVVDINFGLSKGAAVAGLVTLQDSDSTLRGVHVVAHSELTPKIKHHGLTDENGKYLIEGLISGKYIVMADKEGYHPEWYQEKSQMAEADPVKLTEPETTTDINFTLGTAMAITGKVVRARDGEPIHGAYVFAKNFQGGVIPSLVVQHTRTNKNGEYILQVRRAGLYIVAADAEGYIGEIYKDAYKLVDATPVKVELDQHTTGIDFDLVSRGTISGRVVAETTKEPIEGAVVEAFAETYRIFPGHWPIYRARTDSNGFYTIENMASGKYRVKAFARDFMPEFYKEATNPGDATVVTVKDSTDLTDIDFTLIGGGVITGKVVSASDSLPLAKALVCVKQVKADSNENVHTNFVKQALTEKDGSFVVKGLPSGEYIVWAKARGYKSLFYNNAENLVDATKVIVTAPDETPGIDFYLPELILEGGVIAGKIEAEVTDSTATSPTEPLEGAWVIAIPVSRKLNVHLPYWTVTNENGEYTLNKLRPGKYFVAAWAPGYIGEYYDDARHWRQAKAIKVDSNAVVENIDFVLAPAPAGTYLISGQVTNATGQPIDHALIYAKTGSEFNGFAFTDGEGKYIIDNLIPGDYIIEANRVEYENGYYGGSDAGSAQTVAVGNGKQANNLNIQLTNASTAVDNEQRAEALPTRFMIKQNYPNPFNPSTNINYYLPNDAEVTIKIYNLLGQNIRTLIDKPHDAGHFRIQWDGTNSAGNIVPSGLYFCQFKAIAPDGTQFQKVFKMSLIK